MQNNLWMYADSQSQIRIAGSLIVFGAEAFKSANVIKNLDLLKLANNCIQNRIEYRKDLFIQRFIHDYLIDCIKILMFFENYMKAELILHGYCVHNLDNNILAFKTLSKKQQREPITLKEINDIEDFFIDQPQEIITHRVLKETTLGIRTLIYNSKYTEVYEFSNQVLEYIKKLNTIRNTLHFQHEANFTVSTEFIDMLENLDNFVDVTIKRLVPLKHQ